MTANELATGDWIYSPACPDRITEIHPYHIVGQQRGAIPISQIAPLPLTPDILEANGFRREFVETKISERLGVNQRYILQTGDTAIVIMASFCDIRTPNKILPVLPLRYIGFIKHVHELQHAMRLCGLDELADNFKIK